MATTQKVAFRFLDEVEVSFTGTVTIDGEEVSEEVATYLLGYGLKQSVDDAGASPDKGKAGSAKRLSDLLAGTVPAGGGGGARISPVDRELRSIVERYLRSAGIKAAAAEKAAREPEKAFREYLRHAIAEKAGIKPAEVEDSRIETNFVKLFPALREKARKIAEEKIAAEETEIE